MPAGAEPKPLQAARLGARALLTLGVWTLWLALALLLAVQLYVASTDELSLPGFVRRALEARLAASGISATFGRTYFDPTGRIVVENLALTLPGYSEPQITARAVAGRIDPWQLLGDRFEPVELRVTGLSVRVPGLLSLPGGGDQIIRDVDAAFVPRGDEIEIEYLTGRFGEMPVSAQGTVRLGLGAGTKAGPAPLPIAEALARIYPQLSRQAEAALDRLRSFEQPVLQVDLESAVGQGARARIDFAARAYRSDAPASVRLAGLRVHGEAQVGDAAAAPVKLALTADEGAFPADGRVVALSAWVQGRLNGPGRAPGAPLFQPQAAQLTAGRITGAGLGVDRPIVALELARWPRIGAELRGLLWDQRIAVQADVDSGAGAAQVRFSGSVAPLAIDYLGLRLHRDLRPLFAYSTPIETAGEAQFGPAWKFDRAAARIELTGLTAKGVRVDAARGTVEFDGRTLRAPDAFAQLGENFARGSFTEDVATHDYRFLLAGRLRPLDITPWIAGAWWPEFFGLFDFSAEPVGANADISGCFTNGRRAADFVEVHVAQPGFRGLKFDRLHARIFSRPQFTDGLEFEVSRGGGAAAGTFARRYDLDAGALQSFDLAANSTLDLAPLGPLLGANSSPVSAFVFARPPSLGLTAHFAGPAAPGGPHEVLHLDVRTDGPVSYNDFPFDQAAFVADVNDADISLPKLEAKVAGGTLTGSARVWGDGADRRLKVDAALADASLGQAIAVLQEFSARRAHRPSTPPARFVQEKTSVRMNAALSAEGKFGDALSLKGGGTISLEGENLHQIRMLGLFSALLPVTELRFTAARASFRLDGPRLVFPDVRVTGANSALTGSGTYYLDRSVLDFKIRVNPFQESKSFPQQLMDAVVAPLSGALELRLTGKIDKPSLVFANGPTNLLRNLGQLGKPVPAPPAPLAAPPAP